MIMTVIKKGQARTGFEHMTCDILMQCDQLPVGLTGQLVEHCTVHRYCRISSWVQIPFKSDIILFQT